jgi:hypothetical protein
VTRRVSVATRALLAAAFALSAAALALMIGTLALALLIHTASSAPTPSTAVAIAARVALTVVRRDASSATCCASGSPGPVIGWYQFGAMAQQTAAAREGQDRDHDEDRRMDGARSRVEAAMPGLVGSLRGVR